LKIDSKPTVYKFPLPLKIENNIIYGKYYKIMLNPGWKIKEISTSGDLEIVKID